MTKNSFLKNKTLGHFIAVLFFIILGVSFFSAASHMNYTWKWTGVGKYFAYEQISSIDASIDGNVFVEKNRIFVQGADEKKVFDIPKEYTINVANGDTVFHGDALAQTSTLSAGPLLKGLWVTLKISFFSTILAFIIGVIITAMRLSSYQFFKDIATVYITIIRGTPLLVQIFLFYFIIANIFGLDRFLAGALSLGIFCGAYIAEVLRGAIQSIDKGQFEAAKSLGMNYSTTMTLIIIPQALKRSLPALIGEIIALIKDSSLVSVISITDLTKAGREIVANTFAPFETWIVVALMYFVITFLLSILGHSIEKRMKVKGGL